MYLSRKIRLALYFALGLMLGASVTLAHAGYALPAPPQGFSTTAQGFMYKAPAGVAAANGAFQTGVSVNVAGKAVTMPAAMRFAANAGTFAAQAVRVNPYLAVGAVAVWLAEGMIQWDEDAGEWVVTELSGHPSEYVSAQAYPVWNGSNACGLSGYEYIYVSSSLYRVAARVGTAQKDALISQGWSWQNNCSSSHFLISPDFIVQPGTVRPATLTDWGALDGFPPPFEALDPISRVEPLPVQAPELSPVTAPLSDPYLDPVTGQPYRDMVRISPAPTPESPFRVRTDPYKEPVASLDPEAAPITPTEEAPVETIDPKEDPKSFCDEFPDASACAQLGKSAEQPDLVVHTEQVGIEPVSVAPSSGTCPADKSVTTQFGTFFISWGLLCQYASAVRPIILAMAWLSAGFGFFFGARRSS